MSIIINSKFRPFSFQEMLQPVAMAAQAHQALEDQYSELDTKASMWEKLKDSEIDKDVYQQYKAYSDALRASSDELAQSGLTPSSRRAMLDMRARYSQEIAPIEQAWAERDRQMKVQQEMMLKDPTHMYRVNAGQVGLREYMRGNYDALADNYSGALLTKQVGEAASNFRTALMDRSKLKGLGLPYQYERMLQYGATPEQVMQAMSKDPKALPILNKIVDDVMNASGIRGWGNDALTQQAEAYARQGLYNAIGTTKFENFTDNFSSQLALQREKHKMENPKTYSKVQLLGNPYSLDSRVDVNKSWQTHNKFSKFFTKDGRLTNAGLAEYNKTIPITGTSTSGAVSTYGYRQSEFRKFMDSLNGGKPVYDGQRYTSQTAQNFQRLYQSNAQRLVSEGQVNADTYRNKAFDVQLENQENVLQALTSGKNNGKFTTFEYTKDGYKPIGKIINLNDDEFKDATIAGEYGLQGNFVVVTTKKGKQYRIPLSQVNSSSNDAITASLNGARSLYYKDKGMTTRYSDEELDAVFDMGTHYTTMRDNIYSILNSARDNFAAAFEQVKTEPYKVKGGLH